MKRTLLATVIAGAILLSVQATQAQTPTPIYREVFGNNTAFNQNVINVGWAGAYGAGGAAPSTLGGAYTNNFGISSQLGDPQNLDNINAGGAALSTANGLMFTSGGTMASAPFIAYTTGYTVDTAAALIQDITFYAGSANNAVSGIPGFRIAVQIDGNWYATSQVFANTVAVGSAANFNTLAQQMTFTWTTAASAWDSLTFVPGTSLLLGSVLSSPLPGNNITAFGLYSDAVTGAGGATRRFDTFEIDAIVPEPSSIVLALSGLGVLMGFRRFRKV
jgi:hypothetical protein